MLGKLIKNEFKATSRNFIPVYLIMIVVTVFMKAMMEITDNAWADTEFMAGLGLLSIGMFVLALLAVIFGTVVLIIKRFYDNMLKDEGYLTFTLPATTGQHIASKAITSYIWVLASVGVIILSIIILWLGNGYSLADLKDNIVDLIKIINQHGLWKYVIEIVVMLAFMVYAYIMMAYTCLSVGQLFNKHRVGGAIITYIVIYIIIQIIGMIFISYLAIADNMPSEATMIDGFFQPIMLYGLGLSVGESVVFTIVTHVMLNRKLNLE